MFEKTLARFGLQSQKGASVVGTVLVVIISGAVGFYVVVKLLGGLDTSNFTADQNTTFATFQANTNTAFVLIALLAIVVAAGAIMSAVGG